jgi:hypothetical protein
MCGIECCITDLMDRLDLGEEERGKRKRDSIKKEEKIGGKGTT